MRNKLIATVLVSSVFVLMSACSSDSTTAVVPASTPSTLTGTAATGAAILGDVTVKDINGTEKIIATASDGSFTLDVTGMSPAYLLKIVPTDGSETLYSYATQNGQTVNLTPATNLAVFLAAGKNDLDALYSSWNGTALSPTRVADAQNTVLANLTTQLTDAGLDTASFDFFTTSFAADGTGADAVLDNISVTIDAATQSVTVADASGVDLAFNETIGFVLGNTGSLDANAIPIVTVSGFMHALGGDYYSACYGTQSGGSRYDVLTVGGTTWLNSAEAFTTTDCTGTSSSIYKIMGNLSKGSTKQISGWVDGEGGTTTVTSADGKTSLSDTETVTALSVEITGLDGEALNFGLSNGQSIPLFYVVDDTAVNDSSDTNIVLYRDDDGSFASTADPYGRFSVQ